METEILKELKEINKNLKILNDEILEIKHILERETNRNKHR